MPKVSVVLPVYNGEKYLAQAIESILIQTLGDFELIIVDDGSTDQSPRIINSFQDSRIRVLRQSNQRLAHSLNNGIRASRGDYIARMDADDIAEKERLRLQAEFLDEHSDYVLVGTNALVMDEDGVGLYTTDYPQDDNDLREMLVTAGINPFVHGSVMFRKKAAVTCGLYTTRWLNNIIEDLLLWRRIVQMGKVANLPDVLYRYRLSPGAVTALPDSEAVRMRKTLRRIVADEQVSEQDVQELETLSTGVDPARRRSYYELRIAKIYLERLLDQRGARRHLSRAIRAYPLNDKAWFNFALSFLPEHWTQLWRSWRYRRLQNQ